MRFLAPENVMDQATDLRAEAGVVHVWACELSAPESLRAKCVNLLSKAEIEKARRFFHERDRCSFELSHGLLRFILGAYCGEAGGSLEFVANEFGKPALAKAPDASGAALAFNLSHSHGRALIAVTPSTSVGVDLEMQSSVRDVLPLARNYFFGEEFAAIHAVPEPERHHAFYRYWTAKEAVIKAQGRGLAVPLDCFHVAFNDGQHTARVISHDQSHLDPGWFVRVVDCGEGWHGAVAASGSDWSVRLMGEAES
jgi:4'-phosphopantetheinyl transferase